MKKLVFIILVLSFVSSCDWQSKNKESASSSFSGVEIDSIEYYVESQKQIAKTSDVFEEIKDVNVTKEIIFKVQHIENIKVFVLVVYQNDIPKFISTSDSESIVISSNTLNLNSEYTIILYGINKNEMYKTESINIKT